MTARPRPTRFILAIGPLPPPVHGYSLITSLVIGRLQAAVAVEPVDISAGSLTRGWRYHGTRLRRLSRALRAILRGGGEERALYFAVAGGKGVVYDAFLVAAARLRGFRLFIHHNAFTYINHRSRWTAALIRAAGRNATHICLCPAMARGLRAGYRGAGQVLVLSNAALIAPAPSPARNRDQGLCLGFLSNLIPEKGLDVAIAVLRALVRTGAAVRLVVAGPTLDAATRSVLDETKRDFGAAFDYRGAVYDAEKTAFFRDIDLFLFPTRYANEAQPVVILEALAEGVPVIANARGCIPDDLTSGGVVVPPDGDFTAAAVAVVTACLAERARLTALRAAAHARAGAMHRAAQGELGRLIEMMTGAWC